MGYIQFDENAALKFDVTGDELRKHCTERAEFHKARREFYAEKAKEFAEEIEEFKANPPVGMMSGYAQTGTIESNKNNMESQKKSHAERRVFFSFAATHLNQEKYQLSKAQLQELEMVF